MMRLLEKLIYKDSLKICKELLFNKICIFTYYYYNLLIYSLTLCKVQIILKKKNNPLNNLNTWHSLDQISLVNQCDSVEMLII